MTQTEPLNPRAVPGSNEAPDYAKEVTRRLATEYASFFTTFDELEAEAAKLPRPIDTDADALMFGAIIKRFRDLDSRTESVRELEKEPYLRGGNAVDALFNGLRDRIGKRNKNDRKAKNGRVDNLQAEIDDYQNEKLAREQARLEAERREAARLAEEIAKKARAAAAAAEEARQRAERARVAEQIQAKSALATQQEREADEARVRAQQAADAAEEARLATLARPADIVRVRGNDASGAGVTLTAAKEPYALLIDRDKINMEMLRPYFTDAEIAKALRGWAKAVGYKIAMAGAEIGFRTKGVTR